MSAEHDTKRTKTVHWRRPPVPAIDARSDSLAFQQVDIDQYTAKEPLKDMPGATRGPVTVLRMYGVTEAGNSVCAHIHGFTPYMFCRAPPNFTEEHLEAFRVALDKRLQNESTEVQRMHVPDAVLVVSLEYKQSIYGYSEGVQPFLQVLVAMPKIIPAARAICSNGVLVPGLGHCVYPTFESDLPFLLRFMIDRDIVGANWVEMPAGAYTLRDERMHQTSSQIELDIAFNKVVSHPAEGKWSRLAPLRVFSFDIECAGRRGVFPEPKIDPVITIATYIKIQGQEQPICRKVHTLRSCSPIVGAELHSFDREEDLLRSWRDFVVESDPDILTGYNIAKFDLPYLIERAGTLKVDKFTHLGRVIGEAAYVRNTLQQSKQTGNKETKITTILGRVQFDMFQMIQRDYKLSSYSLNAVSAHFLDEQKEDVPHSIITDLFNGSPDDRHRLAVYCLKDAYLPVRLLDKLMGMYNYIEMARVTGVPLGFLLGRGQQIKVISQLYRKARQRNMLIPYMSSGGGGDDASFEGATVIEPKRGFYKCPIATLDFSSLYPSIMMAHNLCYSTLVRSKDMAQSMPPESVTRAPSGAVFVKSSVRQGVLPEILHELIEARKRAKKDLARATDPLECAVLDGRQLALKVSANSVYGFTGATVGKLPCQEISASVTAFGRDMIELTRQSVETAYPGAEVVYGDTDSVMVNFKVDSVEEAMRLGQQAAQSVTTKFLAPISLLFEKVYYPYLLISKKRYAGLYWTKPTHWDKLDAKGIETVRRDNCALVRNVVNNVLHRILVTRDVSGAEQYVKDVVSDLKNNRLDLSLLVITKALSKTGDKYHGKQAHVELAEKMRKRDAGSAPHIGDRVPFVIVQSQKGAAMYEKAEDPIFVLQHNIPLDTTYYLEHQLSKPLVRIFSPIVGSDGDARSRLFASGKQMVIQSSSSSALSKFLTVRKLKCLSCNCLLENDETTVCRACRPNESMMYEKAVLTAAHFEELYAKAWTECQRCMGSSQQEVLCTNRDCPIFYMRKKVQKDLEDAQATLQRFQIDDAAW